jgi:hypothetical protein
MPGEVFRDLAVGELEAWLRQNREPRGAGWPVASYLEEIDDLTARYLTGVDWTPGTPVGPGHVDVCDAVAEAALIAWLRVTGIDPRPTRCKSSQPRHP